LNPTSQYVDVVIIRVWVSITMALQARYSQTVDAYKG
jgi:hypothetical protein